MANKKHFRSKEMMDSERNKWRIKGNSHSSVWQKKIGRSWATWMGGVPNEVCVAASKLKDSDFIACC
ncbi:hypothetical protein M6C35_001974 [Vibrio metschnikovii]|nr:hypothetical protein [Vibrio metschnikovii]